MILTLANTPKNRKKFFIENNKATLRNFDDACNDIDQRILCAPFGGNDSVVLMSNFMSNRVTFKNGELITNV